MLKGLRFLFFAALLVVGGYGNFEARYGACKVPTPLSMWALP